MRWQDGRRSDNVEDRRRSSRRRVATVGATAAGAVSLPVGCAGIVLAGVFLCLGGDPAVLLRAVDSELDRSQQAARQPATDVTTPPGDDALADFVSVVLADTEDVWGGMFAASGKKYPEPRLVLFTGEVASACGMKTSATGPFYCPGDWKIYVDLSFFGELRRRFGADGDFAQAYVLAHEVGHHVQTVTGTMKRVQGEQARASKKRSNELSIALELQADCYAGVWAHHAQTQRQILEAGDIEEGLRAAAAIGDDNIQRMARGYVSPESWTHGSSQQRVEWFTKGMRTGKLPDCDTFR